MRAGSQKLLIFSLMCIFAIYACTLPWAAGTANTAATMVVQTVSGLQTEVAASQTSVAGQVQVPSPAVVTLPTATQTPAPTPTFTNPVVKTTSLCWTGPGTAYPVVSGVKEGTAVELLGVGSTTGWFIIKNPTYGDRCWIEAKNLQLDPLFTTSGLTVFNPPPTPGPKETPLPTNTP